MKINSRLITIIIVIVLFVGAIIWRDLRTNDIVDNEVEAIGKIYRIRHVARKYGKFIYEYEFAYQNNNYLGEVRSYNLDSVRVGDYYKVRFSGKNPENNMMEFDYKYSRIIQEDLGGKLLDTIYELQEIRE